MHIYLWICKQEYIWAKIAVTEGISIPVKKYRVDHKHRVVISPICKTQEREQFFQQIIIFSANNYQKN